MLKNIYYSFIITSLFWSRHFLTVGQPHNAFYYSQTLEEFIFVLVLFFMIFLIISLIFWAAKKFFQKHYKKIVFTTLYISVLPLLDFVFLALFSHIPIQPGFTRLIYPFITFIYVPLVFLIAVKYRIEKYGERVAVILSFISILIVFYAIPRSFGKNVVKNEFISRMKPPIHLIIFDGMSYKVLNDQRSKHLFPNLNEVFANDCFVFEDAHSPGSPTIESIPKLLTGLEYDRYREYNLQFLIAQSENKDLVNLPVESSLFHISQSYDYNNVLIGSGLPYCNLFGQYLSYGESFPSYARLSQLLPLPLSTLLHVKYRHYRNNFLNSFDKYLSRIDSSPQNTFFFVHFLCPHEPFVFDSEGVSNRYWEVILKGGAYKYKEKYMEQLIFVDKKVGEIVRRLKDKNLYDRSLIILTSDHGYFRDDDDMTKVPLLIKAPFQKSRHVVRQRVNTINLHKLFSKFLKSNVVDIKELE